ncbi:MAG: efflux RND transporter periplasmic adaptor subunit [Gemmatimonadaceae bacterium]|nr:efflux RND transporter periplasmic adaptor subunit [Gemmatimonadaceae bacterium]
MPSVPASFVRLAACTLGATLLLAACGGGASPSAGNTAGGGGPGGGGPGGGPGGGRPGGGPGGRAPQITPVEVMLVERAAVSNTSLVTGQLEPLRVVSVNAQLAGALQELIVEEGASVRAGQVIAEIDARELEAQVAAAEAQATFARATAERSAALFAQQIITAAENERDQAARVAADASVTQLRTRLGFAKIRSPLTGVITARFVQSGDIVGNNTRLFTIADLSTLVVRMPVSELEVARLRPGQEVALRVDALGGESVPGRVRRIFPSADSISRLVPVEIAVAGAGASRLRPGYTVRATIRLDTRDDALVVPTRAVLGASGARSVFIVKGGLAERRAVRVGDDVDGKVEVFAGLALGDTVIVAGNSLVREGGSVRIVDPLSPELPANGRPTGTAAGTAAADSTALVTRRTP